MVGYVFAYVFVGNPEHKVSALKIDLRNPRPVVIPYGILVPQDYYTAWSEPQEIFDVVLALMDVVKNSGLFYMLFAKPTSTGCKSTPYISSHFTLSK